MSAQMADDEDQRKNMARFRGALAEQDFTAAESGLRRSSLTDALDRPAAGTTACRDCHPAESASWHVSAHARTWQTLADQGAHVDSYCQQCHSTGFGWPGGFISARRTPSLANVGCESCHGPADAHVKDPTERTPLAAREACTGCHDRENSPDFELAKYWPAIAHGKKRE